MTSEFGFVSGSAGSELKPAQTDGNRTNRGDEDADRSLSALFKLVIERYDGETCENQPHGDGVACFTGGHMYKGMFSRGLMNGYGVFTFADGMKYEGEFVCNTLMGQGVCTWPDGSNYEGEVYHGVRHGTGTYKCAVNNELYEGQWYEGKRQGKGTVYYNEDKTSWYKGNWVKNNREGWGVRRYPSGNIYSGEWNNNLRHGRGTMKWQKLGQEYEGTWCNGIQHGHGTHTWILKRLDGSQYSHSNQYTGNFVQGEKHGHGRFYYAGGAVYEGEWKNNKKHGQGKLTFNDGTMLQGEFVDDQMITTSVSGTRPPTPGGVLPLSGSGTVIALNIEHILEKIPEIKHHAECKQQVEPVVLRYITELKSVYSFYSRLGHTQTPDNIYLLSWLQLWRLLKDCNILHHGFTLAQINQFIREDGNSAETHSPFTTMLFHRFLSCLVIVASCIYHEDMESEDSVFAACFSKLMTDKIFPNATNVKGFLFHHPDIAVAALKHAERSWEIFQASCRVNTAPQDNKTMTGRHLVWLFKDLHMFDDTLTIARLLEVIAAESLDPSNKSSSLDLEIIFLEFFEALLGCVKAKYQLDYEALDEVNPSTRSSPGIKDNGKICQTTTSPSQIVTAPVNSSITPEFSPPLSPKSQETEKDTETPESPVPHTDIHDLEGDTEHHTTEDTEEDGGEGSLKTTAEETEKSTLETEKSTLQTETSTLETEKSTLQTEKSTLETEKSTLQTEKSTLELWTKKIDQFFHLFFGAFDHYQVVTIDMKEDKLQQEAQRRITLVKAQQKAQPLT